MTAVTFEIDHILPRNTAPDVLRVVFDPAADRVLSGSVLASDQAAAERPLTGAELDDVEEAVLQGIEFAGGWEEYQAEIDLVLAD